MRKKTIYMELIAMALICVTACSALFRQSESTSLNTGTTTDAFVPEKLTSELTAGETGSESPEWETGSDRSECETAEWESRPEPAAEETEKVRADKGSFPWQCMDEIAEVLEIEYTNARNYWMKVAEWEPEWQKAIRERYPAGGHWFKLYSDNRLSSRTGEQVYWVSTDFGKGIYGIDGYLSFDSMSGNIEYNMDVVPNPSREEVGATPVETGDSGVFTIGVSGEYLSRDFMEKPDILRIIWFQMIAQTAQQKEIWDGGQECRLEAYLKDFGREDLYYDAEIDYDWGKVYQYTFLWKDHYRFWWKDNRTTWQEAAAKLWGFPGQAHNDLFGCKDSSILTVTGTVRQDNFEKSGPLLENDGIYMFEQIWQGAMECAARLYEQRTGTIEGELRGKIYLETVDDPDTVTVIICLEGEKPVRAIVPYWIRDERAVLRGYTWENLETVETVSEDDMLCALEFCLTTAMARKEPPEEERPTLAPSYIQP